MNKRNYQSELESILTGIEREQKCPTLLLHSCCAPCSSYCLAYLSDHFSITVLYFNPNITEEKEYRKRVEEQKRLIRELPVKHPISFLEGRYDPQEFFSAVHGYEQIPEGGERCFRCYELRLREAAVIAAKEGFDYFTTTLTISPLKNAQKLNDIGEQLSAEYQVAFLNSDFKKKNGYKRSIELSAEYDLYRQDFCGCVFSRQERERQKAAMEQQDRLDG